MSAPATKTLDVDSCINLLVLVDQGAGFKPAYITQDPVKIDTGEWSGNGKYSEIQKVAKRMAAPIGLDNFNFVIALAKQKKSVAAHIELNRAGRDVFIEIDPDVSKFPAAVLAVIAHELTHKWLHERQIHLPDRLENEILTDVASVFLGFGKIALNGCQCESISTSKGPKGVVTQTSTLITGYICRLSFARSYLLMAMRNGTASAELLRGLIPEARDIVWAMQKGDSRLIGENSGSTNEAAREQRDTAAALLLDHKKKIAQAEQQLRSLERSRRLYEDIVATFHRELKTIESDSSAVEELLASSRYAFLPVAALRGRVESLQRMKASLDGAVPIAALVEANLLLSELSTGNPDDLELLCPLDGTRMRVPANKSLIQVTCAGCAYKFLVTTKGREDTPQRGRLTALLSKLSSSKS